MKRFDEYTDDELETELQRRQVAAGENFYYGVEYSKFRMSIWIPIIKLCLTWIFVVLFIIFGSWAGNRDEFIKNQAHKKSVEQHHSYNKSV